MVEGVIWAVSATPEMGREGTGSIRIGPAGWSYADWSGIVYPARKPKGFHQAAYLAEFFGKVTYYRWICPT